MTSPKTRMGYQERKDTWIMFFIVLFFGAIGGFLVPSLDPLDLSLDLEDRSEDGVLTSESPSFSSSNTAITCSTFKLLKETLGPVVVHCSAPEPEPTGAALKMSSSSLPNPNSSSLLSAELGFDIAVVLPGRDCFSLLNRTVEGLFDDELVGVVGFGFDSNTNGVLSKSRDEKSRSERNPCSNQGDAHDSDIESELNLSYS